MRPCHREASGRRRDARRGGAQRHFAVRAGPAGRDLDRPDRADGRGGPEGSGLRRRRRCRPGPIRTMPSRPRPTIPRTASRYLQASVISEPEDTPDITDVTFVVAPTTLVTVRYHPCKSFDLFAQKLCKSSGQALFPDAVAVGLVNTAINRSARALGKAGDQPRPDREPGVPGQGRRPGAGATRSIPTRFGSSAARTRRSPTCARAWCRSSGCCSS